MKKLLFTSILFLSSFLLGFSQNTKNIIPLDVHNSTNEFIRWITTYQAPIEPNSSTPAFTTFNTKATWRNGLIAFRPDKFPDISYSTFNGTSYQEENSSEAAMYTFNKTCGDFVITFAYIWSQMHDVEEYQLYTYDMSGKAIDSLLFSRIIYCSKRGYVTDCVGKLNSNLTVDICHIKFATKTKIIDSKGNYMYGSVSGQRIDTHYDISSTGHFIRKSNITYAPQYYTTQDLLFDNIGYVEYGIPKGINNGTETVLRRFVYPSNLSVGSSPAFDKVLTEQSALVDSMITNPSGLINGLGAVGAFKKGDVIFFK